MNYSYKAFISYSHAADNKLAPSLQSGIQRINRPWYKFSSIKIFRDETSLSNTPHLWYKIEEALKDSEYFILMASPEAAKSEWVEKEINYWLEYKDKEKLLIVLTDGTIEWDKNNNDFKWDKTSALPKILSKVFEIEPKYTDLRWARKENDLTLKNTKFEDNIADIASTLHDIPKDEFVGDLVKMKKRAQLLTSSIIFGLLILTIISALLTWYSISKKNEAIKQSKISRSRELAAFAVLALEKDPSLSFRLAEEAIRHAPVYQAERIIGKSMEYPFHNSLSGHEESVWSAEFSPDGSRIVTASLDQTALIWDSATGKELHTLSGHERDVLSAEFSPDGSRIVTASKDGTALIWDSVTGKELHTLSGHEGVVESAEFSPDGSRIVTASYDNTARVWPANSQGILKVIYQDKIRGVVRELTEQEKNYYGFTETKD